MRKGYEVGVWKAIKNEWEGIKGRSCFSIGNRRRVKILERLMVRGFNLGSSLPKLNSLLLLAKMEG